MMLVSKSGSTIGIKGEILTTLEQNTQSYMSYAISSSILGVSKHPHSKKNKRHIQELQENISMLFIANLRENPAKS